MANHPSQAAPAPGAPFQGTNTSGIRKPFLWSVVLLGVLALTLWMAGSGGFWTVYVVGFFGIPTCGLLLGIWLMMGAAIHPHRRAFAWGLSLGMLPLLGWLMIGSGWSDWLACCYLPICNLLAVVTLTAIKPTRWFGIGLTGGLLFYMMIDGIILAFWLSI